MARIEITVSSRELVEGCVGKGAITRPWFCDIYLNDGFLIVEVHDPDADLPEVEAPLTFRFTADDIAAAVSRLSNLPTRLWQWHDPDTWDADAVDMILQQAAFGEQVYS